MANFGTTQRTLTSSTPSSTADTHEPKGPHEKLYTDFKIYWPFSIPLTSEAAAIRIIKNLENLGLYYTLFVWIILFITLIPQQQPIENYYVNNKLLLPRKPARRPNPIIKLRRGSAAARIPRKQIEPGNDKEEWITQSEEEHNDKKGKYEPEMSMQKSSKNSSPILNKNRKKKSSSNDKGEEVVSGVKKFEVEVNYLKKMEAQEWNPSMGKNCDMYQDDLCLALGKIEWIGMVGEEA
ncbi:hypothetical protein SESBI_00228 [Sesbania bispinosa]|nr:hypothetical protein SESBI_00228 [Sesbania bispinosa]